MGGRKGRTGEQEEKGGGERQLPNFAPEQEYSVEPVGGKNLSNIGRLEVRICLGAAKNIFFIFK